MARKSVPVIELPSVESTIDVDGGNPGTDGAIDGSASDSRSGEPELISGFESFNPVDASGDSDSGAGDGPRKRGRKPGSKNRKAAASPSALAGIETILINLHVMAAAFFQTPELQLADTEARDISNAVANVAKHYNHNFDPKIIAWVNLGMVAGTVYGSRFAVIRARQKMNINSNSNVRPVPVLNFQKSTQQTEQPQPKKTNGAVPTGATPADIFGLGYTAADTSAHNSD